MNSQDYIDHISRELNGDFLQACFIATEVIRSAERIYIAGNGGSAAIASHFAQDLIVSCGMDARCLTDSIPVITALANDYSYSETISRQLGNLRGKDCTILISGSGESHNILEAADMTIRTSSYLVCMTGQKGSSLDRLSKEHKFPRKQVTLILPHFDIRGQEDLFSIACHLITRELHNE